MSDQEAKPYCATCGGTGKITLPVDIIPGVRTPDVQEVDCPDCAGHVTVPSGDR